jgi:hypothetical protein
LSHIVSVNPLDVIKDKLTNKEGKYLKLTFLNPITIRLFKLVNMKEAIFKTAYVKDNKVYLNIRKTMADNGTGYLIDSLINDFYNIIGVELVDKQEKKFTFQDVLNKRYDNQTWTSIREKNFNGEFDPPITFRKITRDFYKSDLIRIEAAFKLKKEISVRKYGTKRDFSVETKLVNGEFKAWFSSEYAGCGNGDYYILLNPKTAVFVEND